MSIARISTVIVVAAMSVACRRQAPAAEQPDGPEVAQAAPTNRVDIPAPVRSNLGITFAKVERRDIANLLRVPGRFELQPEARREHRAPLSGRVDIAVKQYQPVKAGDVLYRLDAPEWRSLQRELTESTAAVDIAEARLGSLDPIMEAHRMHEQGLRESVELWSERVTQLKALAEAGGGRAAELAEAQANLTQARAAFGEVMEKDAELQLQRQETESVLRSAQGRLDLLQSTAAALLGASSTASKAQPAMRTDAPFWRDVAQIEVQAAVDGVVERVALTNGGWAGEGELVMSVVDPGSVRFRAIGMQSDLERLQPGLEAWITPPRGSEARAKASIPTTLQIGLDADPNQRTIELLAVPSRSESWARPGVSAFLEIATSKTAAADLAIPMSTVVHDGLTPIIFRRDPANPDKAIRLEADLGINDGRWVVIKSGVREGDEVVLDGVYQLLLATASGGQKGGHFHADGTFHASEDE